MRVIALERSFGIQKPNDAFHLVATLRRSVKTAQALHLVQGLALREVRFSGNKVTFPEQMACTIR